MSGTGRATSARAGRARAQRGPTSAVVKRRRLLASGFLFCSLLLVLGARLAQMQELDAAQYTKLGAEEEFRTVPLPAMRGTVYDRGGNLLSVSVQGQDLVADDYLISHPATEAAQLAPVLGQPAQALTAELSEQNGYVVLGRMVSQRLEDSVSSMGLPGIYFVADSVRNVPTGQLFTPVLGVVGFGGHGLSGLEYQYDGQLFGTAGSEEIPQSPTGVELPGSPRYVQEPLEGSGLVLTLDEPLQWEVTTDLAAQIRATKADGGMCVITDPKTGAILAMVDLVTEKNGTVVPAEQNLALTSVYQPGSVMKLVTISGSIQSGLISPTTRFTVPYSTYLGGWQFEDAEYHPTESMPVSQILAQSSNIGTIEIAHLLGPERLSYYLHDFGYGQYTGLNWPGESAGLVAPLSQWSDSSMGAVPIGTGEAVTPMQILDAYNAVANGGIFVPPRLVDATVSGSGIEHELPYAATHRILSSSTAAEVVPMLEGVVNDGTGTAAQISGYPVAGKTGTAQIPSTTGPGYQPGAWMATFVGFLPAQNPSLSGIVVLDHPRTAIYGGTVAAPVFSEIMRYALRHFDVPPVGSDAIPTP